MNNNVKVKEIATNMSNYRAMLTSETEEPIVLSAEAVKAILEGRKTMTRLPIKPKYRKYEEAWQVVKNVHTGEFVRIEMLDRWEDCLRYVPAPWQIGDTLWVRESWAELRNADGSHKKYVYRATDEYPFGETEGLIGFRWKPSLHMRREAARLFLKVKNFKVEYLQEIDTPSIKAEGFSNLNEFIHNWNNSITPKNKKNYNWNANPWVWALEFELCTNPPETN